MVHESTEWNTEHIPVNQLVSVDTAKITLQYFFSCNSKLKEAQFVLLRKRNKPKQQNTTHFSSLSKMQTKESIPKEEAL